MTAAAAATATIILKHCYIESARRGDKMLGSDYIFLSTTCESTDASKKFSFGDTKLPW